MTAEEFIQAQKDLAESLVKKYTEQFGESPPDLSDISFWGSEIDALKEAIDSGVLIQLTELPEQADL